MEQLAPKLFVYGPLGIICVILLYAVIKLYQAKEKLALDKDAALEKKDDALEKIRVEHRTEMQALVDRHIAKAEKWVEKGNELATNLHAVLESIVKRKG